MRTMPRDLRFSSLPLGAAERYSAVTFADLMMLQPNCEISAPELRLLFISSTIAHVAKFPTATPDIIVAKPAKKIAMRNDKGIALTSMPHRRK